MKTPLRESMEKEINKNLRLRKGIEDGHDVVVGWYVEVDKMKVEE